VDNCGRFSVGAELCDLNAQRPVTLRKEARGARPFIACILVIRAIRG